MQISKLKKDIQLSVRINSDIKAALELEGISAQKILDEYINKKYAIKIEKKGSENESENE